MLHNLSFIIIIAYLGLGPAVIKLAAYMLLTLLNSSSWLGFLLLFSQVKISIYYFLLLSLCILDFKDNLKSISSMFREFEYMLKVDQIGKQNSYVNSVYHLDQKP